MWEKIEMRGLSGGHFTQCIPQLQDPLTQPSPTIGMGERSKSGGGA